MSYFLLNIILALLWAAVNGSFTETTLLVGFVIGYVAIALAEPLFGSSRYLQQVFQVPWFFVYFVKELVLSSIRVARDVLAVDYEKRVQPGIIAIPLDVESDLAITLLANTISLTPGTLSLDVSDDKQVLYIHSMYVTSPDAVREEIKGGLERRVREVVR